jgi:hypothetical protein
MDQLTVGNFDAPVTPLNITDGGLPGDQVSVAAGGAGIQVPNGDVSLNGFAFIFISNQISIGSGTLTLGGAGSLVDQFSAGALTAAKLLLTGSGVFSLTQPNNMVGTLAANVGGSLGYANATALTVGTVGTTSGVNTNGNSASLFTGGTLTLSQSITTGPSVLEVDTNAGGVTQLGGVLTAADLRHGGSGTFNLNQAGNAITTIAVDLTGSLTYRNNATDLIVGAVDEDFGINTGNNSVTLSTGGALLVNQVIHAGTSTIALTVGTTATFSNAQIKAKTTTLTSSAGTSTLALDYMMAATTFTITGLNAGGVSTNLIPAGVSFSGFANLIGTNVVNVASYTFIFLPGGMVATIDGGQNGTLNFAAVPGVAVTVNSFGTNGSQGTATLIFTSGSNNGFKAINSFVGGSNSTLTLQGSYTNNGFDLILGGNLDTTLNVFV